MPAYPYQKGGVTHWFAKINYQENGQNRQLCKRGFDTKEDAQLYEEAFLLKYRTSRQPMSERLRNIIAEYVQQEYGVAIATLQQAKEGAQCKTQG